MYEFRSHSNRERAEAFGSAADAYDRSRPDYPPALIDDLVAGRPASALDIGTGTGKAARLLAERGVPVVGVEVDDRMAEVARGHGLSVETATFETWDAAGRGFDLIVCGQAWHWVEPVAGGAKVRQLLHDGGLFAAFWNFAMLADDVRLAFDAVYQEFAPGVSEKSVIRGGGPSTVPGYIPALEAQLGPVVRQDYAWDRRYQRDEWLEMISTHSDHIALPADQLGALLAGLGAVIDGLGGSVTAHYVTSALSARPA